MIQLPLFPVFLLALIAYLFGNLFFASFPVLAFSPFLVFVFAKKRLYPSLWIATLIGALCDLTNTTTRFGLLALSFTIASALAFHFKKWFHSDHILFFPLFTTIFSLALNLAQALVLSSQFHWSWLLLPLLDGLFAFIWFTCPLSLYLWFLRKRRRVQ